MGFYTNLDSYGPNPSPNGSMGSQNNPYFTFGGFDFGSISDISDRSGRLFGKCSENGSGIFLGPNFRAEESSGLMGSKCQTEPRRPISGPTNVWDSGAFWETPRREGFPTLVIRNHCILPGFRQGHRAIVAKTRSCCCFLGG